MISNYFHTIRYLKFKQIYHRIWYFLYKPTVSKFFDPKLRFPNKKFILPIRKNISLSEKDVFNFFYKSMPLSKIGWNGGNKHIHKLWLYNLHYFDDLNAVNSFQRKILHNDLLENWVNENKFGHGVGWEPYPTSIRIVNWIKWHLSGNNLSSKLLKSLAIQASWLEKRIEWHILGNHLFSNAKALIFAGLFFDNKDSKSWLNKGLEILNFEINEQILEDGGHFERSPMYHSIILEDLLDIINISQVYSEFKQNDLLKKCKEVIYDMLKWLDTMLHPDGNISFFNDSALNAAANFKDLKEYANRLNINYISSKFDKVTNLSASGYIRISHENFIGFLDVAPIGPDYIPGHAHADTLSFEISLYGRRLLINGGTSEYENGEIRHYERSTKAHNTVCINDEDSSEVWKSFRVARRAYPLNLEIINNKDYINVSCSHDGYSRLSGRPKPKREWTIFEKSFVIRDNIYGNFNTAFAYFHFHPSVKILNNNHRKITVQISNNKKATFEISKGKPMIISSYYSPDFGKRIKTKCLKISLDKKKGSCLKISWND